MAILCPVSVEEGLTTALGFLGGEAASGLLSAAIRKAFPDPNDRWRTEAEEQYRSLIHELHAKIRRLDEVLRGQGVRVEAVEALLLRRVSDDIMEDLIDGASPVKREALSNAAARLFDTSWQTLDARLDWFRLLRTLSGSEIEVLRKVGSNATLSFDGGVVVAYLHEQQIGDRVEVAGLHRNAVSLSHKGALDTNQGGRYNGSIFIPNSSGMALIHMASPIGPSS